MSKQNQYQAKLPNRYGVIEYSDHEHQIWQQLYQRQIDNLPSCACNEYLQGLAKLALPQDRIPQLVEVDEVLLDCTGWQTEAVPALIPFAKFFELLANAKFPVATFIRNQNEFDYLQEPDVFHEIFGHCPLLTNASFARYSQAYGRLGLAATKEERVFLARLYWFTVEFGLLKSEQNELSIYGGGILSSPSETLYAMSDKPELRSFNLVDVLRTPYRIDIIQPIYYMIESLSFLDEIVDMDIMAAVKQARQLGLFTPTFPSKNIAS